MFVGQVGAQWSVLQPPWRENRQMTSTKTKRSFPFYIRLLQVYLPVCIICLCIFTNHCCFERIIRHHKSELRTRIWGWKPRLNAIYNIRICIILCMLRQRFPNECPQIAKNVQNKIYFNYLKTNIFIIYESSNFFSEVVKILIIFLYVRT